MEDRENMVIFLVSDMNPNDAAIMHEVGCKDSLISYWHLMSSQKAVARLYTFVDILENGIQEADSENS